MPAAGTDNGNETAYADSDGLTKKDKHDYCHGG